MDDVDICPPWWPNFLWWLIHHPHNGHNGIDKTLVDATKNVLIGLQSFHYAHTVADGEARAELQHEAVRQMTRGVEELSGVGAAR